MKIVPVTGKLPATRVAVDRFLAAPRLMRLGVTEPDGTPLVHPVWYTWEEDQFLLHIGTTSSKRTAIDAQSTVYFTVDDMRPGIFGVRGKAIATIDPDQDRLCEVTWAQYDRYTGAGDNETRRFLMGMVEAGDLVL
jgi:Pyridoxamine 5'-phosphate oxidase